MSRSCILYLLVVIAFNSSLATELHNAVWEGDEEKVQCLLFSKESDINAKCYFCFSSNVTPLHLAVIKNNYNMVELLLNNNPKPLVDVQDGCKATPLHHAALKGFAKIVKLLLDNNASINIQKNRGETPLYLASLNGHIDVVRLLLEKHNELKDRSCYDMLHSFCSRGEDVCLLSLAKAGLDFNAPDCNGIFPLQKIALEGRNGLIKNLLSIGAKGLDVNCSDKYGNTPLHYAAFRGSYQSAFRLMENGFNIDVHAINKSGLTPWCIYDKTGETLLNNAVKQNDLDSIKCFLVNKVGVNIPSNNGNTPLSLVVNEFLMKVNDFNIKKSELNGSKTRKYEQDIKCKKNIIKYLLKKDADALKKDKNERSVLKKVFDSCNQELLESFEPYVLYYLNELGFSLSFLGDARIRILQFIGGDDVTIDILVKEKIDYLLDHIRNKSMLINNLDHNVYQKLNSVLRLFKVLSRIKNTIKELDSYHSLVEQCLNNLDVFIHTYKNNLSQDDIKKSQSIIDLIYKLYVFFRYQSEVVYKADDDMLDHYLNSLQYSGSYDILNQKKRELLLSVKFNNLFN